MIADAIRQAQQAHRKAIESTYDGTCSIYEQQTYEDPETLDTVFREVQVQDNIPCHLSYSSSPATAGSETGTVLKQVIKLFLTPEIEVKPGSRIVVVQQGINGHYSRSGQPSVYFSHQEIVLELFRGYA